MTGNYKRFLIMPILLSITPKTLVLPNTVPMAQQQQAVGGVLRWASPNWDKTEYESIQRVVNAITPRGMQLEDFVMKMAEAVQKIIPDREFSVNIGTFETKYKPKEKLKKGGNQ